MIPLLGPNHLLEHITELKETRIPAYYIIKDTDEQPDEEL